MSKKFKHAGIDIDNFFYSIRRSTSQQLVYHFKYSSCVVGILLLGGLTQQAMNYKEWELNADRVFF